MMKFFIPQPHGATVYLPYLSNRPIDKADATITRVVFSIHGSHGNAQDYLDRAMDAARKRPGALEESLIIAPYFRETPLPGTEIPAEELTWDGRHWWGGESSSALAGSAPVSSFHCIDRMAAAVLNKQLFPNLKKLVFVGHSGGGQFVNRYAASSRFLRITAGNAGVRLHFIPMNPGNYLYMDGRRRTGTATSPMSFAPPTAQCPNYNHYGRGLIALLAYHNSNGMTPESMRTLNRDQRVTYLSGANDTERDESLPQECGDWLQGLNRRERAATYFEHLNSFGNNSFTKRQRLLVVPGAGHNGRTMMTSGIGVAAIYEPVVEPTVEVFQLAGDGKLGAVVDQQVWSNGWTQAKTYEVGGQDYLFLLKEEGGEVHIHKLMNNGQIGAEIQRHDWVSDWSSVVFYTVASNTYLLLYNKSSGLTHIRRMNADGTTGAVVPLEPQDAIGAGWDSVVPFFVGGTPFLFLLNEEKDMHIHAIDSSGRIKAKIDDRIWTEGWSSAAFFQKSGATYLALLKRGNGEFHSHRMNADGKVGDRIDTEDWSNGWSHMLSYRAGVETFLLILKSAEGRMITRRIKPDGGLGSQEEFHWSPGLTSLSTFAAGSNTYLLALKKHRIES